MQQKLCVWRRNVRSSAWASCSKQFWRNRNCPVSGTIMSTSSPTTTKLSTGCCVRSAGFPRQLRLLSANRGAVRGFRRSNFRPQAGRKINNRIASFPGIKRSAKPSHHYDRSYSQGNRRPPALCGGSKRARGETLLSGRLRTRISEGDSTRSNRARLWLRRSLALFARRRNRCRSGQRHRQNLFHRCTNRRSERQSDRSRYDRRNAGGGAPERTDCREAHRLRERGISQGPHSRLGARSRIVRSTTETNPDHKCCFISRSG